MNPYLKALREQYAALRASVEGFQARAAEQKRPLTAEERSTVEKQGADMATLAAEITALTEIETRNASVDQLAADIKAATGPVREDDPAIRSNGNGSNVRPVGGATSQERDPGHYKAAAEGGQRSFFRDLVLAREGDNEAATRIVEHGRALSTGATGAGVIAPKWLTELFARKTSNGRPLANAVRRISLGNDPRPMTLPRQTTGTDNVVGNQASENTAPNFTDAWNATTDTVTPVTITGGQKVSRQLLDSSTPAVDELIMSDLLRVYNSKIERLIAITIENANTSLLTATGGTDPTVATHYNKRVLDAMITVLADRAEAPDILTMSPRRYGKALGMTDTTGRPLLVSGFNMGPNNASGVGGVSQAFRGDAIWHGVQALASPGFYDDGRVYTFNRDDVILFESDMLRFRYEEPEGPQTIIMGVWAYAASYVMYKPQSVKGVTITGDGESA